MSSIQPISLYITVGTEKNNKRKNGSSDPNPELKRQKFEEITFFHLPDPVVVKIFTCAQQTLPILRLTCKLWKEKIDTNPNLIARYWLLAAKKLSHNLNDYYTSVGEALLRAGDISGAEQWALNLPCEPLAAKARVDLFYAIALCHLQENPIDQKKIPFLSKEKIDSINVEKSNRALEFRKKAIEVDDDLFKHQEFSFYYLFFCIQNRLFSEFTIFLSQLELKEDLDDVLMRLMPHFVQNWEVEELHLFKEYILNPKNLRMTATVSSPGSSPAHFNNFDPLAEGMGILMEASFSDPQLSFDDYLRIKNDLDREENSILAMPGTDEVSETEKTDFDVFYSNLACALFEKGYEVEAKKISKNIFGLSEKEPIIACEIKKAIQSKDLERATGLFDGLNENCYAMCNAALALAEYYLDKDESKCHHYLSIVKEKSLEASNGGYNFTPYWTYMLQVILFEYKIDLKKSSIKKEESYPNSYKTLGSVFLCIANVSKKHEHKTESFFRVLFDLKNNKLIGLLKILSKSNANELKKYSSIMLVVYDLDAKEACNILSSSDWLPVEQRISNKLKYFEYNFLENQKLSVFIREVREFISTVDESKYLETICYKSLVYITKYLEKNPKLANSENKLVTETVNDMYKIAIDKRFLHFEGIIAYLYLLLKDSKKATEFLQKGDSGSKMVAFLQNRINEFEPRRVLKNE